MHEMERKTMAETAVMPGLLAVHSVDHFCFSVPDLDEAERFYWAFRLDVRRSANCLDLYTMGHSHRWGTVHANGKPKRQQYMTFGIWEQDMPAFRGRIAERGIACSPHPLAPPGGLWLSDPDRVPLQLIVADKVTPSVK